jgi:hypothetical protein
MPYAWISPPNVVRDVCLGPEGQAGVPIDQYAPEIAALYDTLVPDGTVNGATLVNGVWTNPPPYVPPEPPPVVEPVPDEVTLFQAQAALLLTPSPIPGKTYYDLVEEFCQAEGGLTLLAWNKANTVVRGDSFTTRLKVFFQWTDEQFDDLFQLAKSIDGNAFQGDRP